MCFDSKSFLNLSPLPVPLHISLPNSYQLFVTHIGEVYIHPDMILKRVLYVPSFKYNLLSVHKLCSQFKYSINLTSSECLLQVPLMRRGQIFGEVRDGLYLLRPRTTESRILFSKDVVSIPKTKVPFSIPVLANVVPNVTQ